VVTDLLWPPLSLLLPCCLQDFVDVRELTREEEVAKGLDLLTRLHGVAGRGKEYVLKELSDFGLAGRSGSDAQLLKQLAGKYTTEKFGQSASPDLVRRVSKLPSWEAVCEMCSPADCADGADGADGATAGSGAGSPPSAPANAAEPSTAPFLPKGCQVAFKFSTGWAVGVVKEVLRDGEKRTRVVAYACTSGSDSSARPSSSSSNNSSSNNNSSDNGTGFSPLGAARGAVSAVGNAGLGAVSAVSNAVGMGPSVTSRNSSSIDFVQEFPDVKLIPAEGFVGFRFAAGERTLGGDQPDPYPEKAWARVVGTKRLQHGGSLRLAKAGLNRVNLLARDAVFAVSSAGAGAAMGAASAGLGAVKAVSKAGVDAVKTVSKAGVGAASAVSNAGRNVHLPPPLASAATVTLVVVTPACGGQ
jgi:hypothetical protein